MWSLTKVIGLVILPLMIGSAVLGSLNTMTTASVNPQYNTMDAILERENNRLYIDQNATESAIDNQFYNSPDPGAEMFRDVIAVSQLSALSCTRAGDLIAGRMIMGRVPDTTSEAERDSTTDQGFPIIIPEDVKDQIGNNWKKTPYYAFPARYAQNTRIERAPNYALQFTDYTPRCVGVQRAESALPDAGVLTDPVGYVVGGTVDTIVSAPGDVWDFVTCKTVPGWVKRAGNDMEGRYGRVPFKLSDNLEDPIILAGDKPGDIRRDMVWTANFVNEHDGTCWQGIAVGSVAAVGVGLTAGAAGSFAGGGPATGAIIGVAAGSAVATSYDWAGQDVKLIPTMAGAEFARYAPYDIEVIEGDSNWPGINLKYGHVVVDAPIVLAGSESSIENAGSRGSDARGLKFQEEAMYVLCPGTTGYIQTNRDDDGRSGGEHVPADDPGLGASKITTYIHVTGGNPTSCVEGGNNYVVIDDRVRIEYFDSIDS